MHQTIHMQAKAKPARQPRPGADSGTEPTPQAQPEPGVESDEGPAVVPEAEPQPEQASEHANGPRSARRSEPARSSRRELRRAALALGLPLFALALLLAPARAQMPGEGMPGEGMPDGGAPAAQPVALPAPQNGEEALKQASDARRAAYKLKDAAREVGLMDAAAAYGRVADAPAGAAAWTPADRAEGAFRAGEILRSLGQLIEALARFEQATTYGDDADAEEFAARGLLEQAHLRRRNDDPVGAIELYDAVRARFPEQRRSAAHAWTWSGKLLLQGEQRDVGRERLLSFATEYPEYPAEAVRNADAVAADCFEDNDVARARQVRADISATMQPLLSAGGKQADSIRRSLERMKITKLLGDPGDVADVPDEGDEET